MPKIILKTFFIGAAAFFLFLAVPVFARVELEVSFPEIGGVGLDEDTTLPNVIKYTFNILTAVILLIILFSLIYGGFLYMSSGGRPDVMTAGKKRLTGSALGLVILLGAYFLLYTLNPQLTVLKIKKEPVVAGVILLNNKAFSDAQIINTLTSGADEEISEVLQTLIDAPDDPDVAKAYYLSTSISDLTKVFGDWILGDEEGWWVTKPMLFSDVDVRLWHKPYIYSVGPTRKEEFNFNYFQVAGLYFLPGTNTKVLSYRNRDFNKDIEGGFSAYNAMEKIMDLTNPLSPIDSLCGRSALGQEEWLKSADYEYLPNKCTANSAGGSGPCRFELLEQGFGWYCDDGPFHNDPNKITAPLSLKLEGIDRGVYLYSRDEESGEVYLGRQVYLRAGDRVPFLSASQYDFDLKTEQIEIRNWLNEKKDKNSPVEPVKKGNLLAILHEEEFFKGKLRVFFENFKFGPPDWDISGNIEANTFESGSSLPPIAEHLNYKATADIRKIVGKDKRNWIEDRPTLFGQVDTVSSVQVFNIDDSGQTSCEVILCAEKGLEDCFAFLVSAGGATPSAEAKNNVKGGIIDYWSTPDYFLRDRRALPGAPVHAWPAPNLFTFSDGIMVDRNEDGAPDEESGQEIRVPLYEHLGSMKIIGNCVVVLFDTYQKDNQRVACQTAKTPEEYDKNCAGSSTHSEVFMPWSIEHRANNGYVDLTESNKHYEHRIGMCDCDAKQGSGGFIWWDDCTSCARSILIYPVKR